MARGEYIAHMDDDDISLPDRLVSQLRWMNRNGVDICGGCAKKFGTQDGIMWFPEAHEAICHELIFSISQLLPTVLLKADIAKAHPYDEALVFSDYAMLTQIANRYRLGNTPKIVLKSRCHGSQIHLVQRSAFESDKSTYRQAYFYSLFPEARADDYRVVAVLAEEKPFESLADLEQAGIWLVRLAQTPDTFLRKIMGNRWRAVCRRSNHLGLNCDRLYRRIAPLFESDIPPHL